MLEIRQTAAYSEWFAGLRDRVARSRIDIRIRRLSLGNAGDVKAVGDVSELRVDYGPGYRVYFVRKVTCTWFSLREATSRLKTGTSARRKRWRAIYRS